MGGYTIGQVWKTADNPNIPASQFLEGTVVAKLLFTEFDPTDIPSLAGSLTWRAAIHADPACRRGPPMADGSEPDKCARDKPKDMRLLQLDVAVKDGRAGKTAWVFGTFVYNGYLGIDQSPLLPAGAPWNRLVPVGLMWGNDPTIGPNSYGSIQQTRILSTGVFQHLGCGGRLNGPIDNPASSCLSCHSQAQFPPSQRPLTPSKCDSAQANMNYFRNLGPSDVFDSDVTGAVALDFSLQMQQALRNFNAANPKANVSNMTLMDGPALMRSFETLNR